MRHYSVWSAQDVAARVSSIKRRAQAAVTAKQTPAPSSLRHRHGADDIQLQKDQILHAGFFSSDRLWVRHPRFDGTLSGTMIREVWIGTDAALILPYDPVADKVMLLEQVRMGPYARGDANPWTLEPIAGMVDPGETPADCAHREAMEEAGIRFQGLNPIASYYATPGASTDYFHSFIGICDLSEAGATTGGLQDEGEDIFVHVVPFTKAMQLIETGEIQVGPLILMLLWLARNRETLRASA
ncbi:NUDIX domain-containing protein [Pseudaestuariivita rosea]|uniref:NUDIX domain-containing protein n=1 Tax=Pseudaestuariivita rosea TaxID=2763263 RepID=UPI001ABAD17D|nr:NUDIX domain-containing protein [Pseudaestuariivita rosea]